MISKELLSEVLGFEPDVFKVKHNEISYAIVTRFSVHWEVLNIYELAHKCKEWAYDKGYMIDSCGYSVKIISPKYEFEHIYTIKGDTKTTKPYDIWRDIEACQWILDNKDKQ